jgi:acyl carrier protein
VSLLTLLSLVEKGTEVLNHTNTHAKGALSFDQLWAALAERLGFPSDTPLVPTDGLYDDLGIDSIQALEMLVLIEAAADLQVPPAMLPEMYTLQDAYEYYCFARELARSEVPV